MKASGSEISTGTRDQPREVAKWGVRGARNESGRNGSFFFCDVKPSVCIRCQSGGFMPDSLTVLQSERDEIQRKISRLGDMRAGSITTTGGRCGNRGCHCRKEGDPGHGPFYRLTRKVRGKPVT